MKKKLLLMVPMLHQGGFERVCIETARCLGEDMEVTILIFSDQNIHYDISGLHVENINVPSAKGRLAKIRNVIRRVWRVRRYKREHPSDYCYSFGQTANIVNALSGRAGRVKVLVGLRSAMDVEERLQMRLFLLCADEILVCSKEIQDHLKREYACDRLHVAYNPVDVENVRRQATEQLPEAPFFPQELGIRRLVTVGREDRAKGYWHLIKAFSLLHERMPGARLVIVGSGSFARYQELAKTLGVGDAIRFAGNLRNPFPCVAEAELYVMTSNKEGNPNALIEAMALGKPCLAADCRTGPRELLLSGEEYKKLADQHIWASTTTTIEGEYGILVRDMDSTEDMSATVTPEDEDLAAEMERVLLDTDKMAHYGKKAYERALQLTPERYREELLRIFSVVDERGRG